MSAVTLASLDDLRAVVADLLDTQQPLVVGRKQACRLLDISDSTFGRLVREGHIRPVPHLRPARYSIEQLRRLAAGDEHAFTAPIPGAGSTGTDNADAEASPAPADGVGHEPDRSGSVSPLRGARRRQGTGGHSTARGGPTSPAA